MKLLIPLLSLLALLWLAALKPNEQGYNAKDIEALNMLADNPDRAELLKLWGLTEEEVAQPINLWSTDRKVANIKKPR